MAYESGFLNRRVTVRNKVTGTGFGETTKFSDVATVWASVTFTKGMKALHEGALDAYDTVMIRMRWNSFTKRDSLLIYENVTYQITSFHADKQENTIQITAVEVVQGAPYPALTPIPSPTPDDNNSDNVK